MVSEFLSLYPEIYLDLDFKDRIIDLVKEGVSAAHTFAVHPIYRSCYPI